MCDSFESRFWHIAQRISPFCLGIDPSPEILKIWDLQDSVLGLRKFGEAYLEWTLGLVEIVKFQIAYFERFGSDGIAVLEDLIREFRARRVLVVVDAKRGDISNTASAYAQAYFGGQSALRADAITAHAYLGFDSVVPLIKAAREVGGYVFIVVASSNPEGRILQSAKIDGSTVAGYLASEIGAYNAAHGPATSCGAVVGATRSDISDGELAPLGAALLLCPGIGEQGASISSLTNRRNARSIIPTSSRAIARSGGDRDQFRQRVGLAAEQARALWGP